MPEGNFNELVREVTFRVRLDKARKEKWKQKLRRKFAAKTVLSLSLIIVGLLMITKYTQLFLTKAEGSFFGMVAIVAAIFYFVGKKENQN